jgi:hypothetical protein
MTRAVFRQIGLIPHGAAGDDILAPGVLDGRGKHGKSRCNQPERRPRT